MIKQAEPPSVYNQHSEIIFAMLSSKVENSSYRPGWSIYPIAVGCLSAVKGYYWFYGRDFSTVLANCQ